MSLVGVSLTNKLEGLYLGKVNLNNFDASANSIVYTTDGSTMKGNQLLEYDETINTLMLNNDAVGTAGNAHISLNGDIGGVNKALTSNGEQGLKWVPLADGQTRYVYSDVGTQQTTPTPMQTLTLYTRSNQYNTVPNLTTFLSCIFNMYISENDVLTLNLINTDDESSYAVQIMNITGGAYQNIPVLFQFTMNSGYNINFRVDASVANSGNTVSFDTNSYYSTYMYQLVPSS